MSKESQDPGVSVPEEAQESKSLRDLVTAKGYDAEGFESDDDVLDFLLSNVPKEEDGDKPTGEAEAEPEKPATPDPEPEAAAADDRYEALQRELEALRQQVSRPVEPPRPEKTSEPAKLWDPPEYNPAWLSQVTQDKDGNWIPAKGAPADVVPKLQAYAAWRQEQQDKFWSDPFSFIAPYVRQVAEEVSGGTIQQTREQSQIESIIEDNASWLFKDDSRMEFSEEGQLFQEAVGRVPNASPREKLEFGLAFVERERLKKQIENPAAAAEKKHALKKLKAIERTPNHSGTLAGDDEQNPDLPVEQRLRAAFEAAGISDKDFADYR